MRQAKHFFLKILLLLLLNSGPRKAPLRVTPQVSLRSCNTKHPQSPREQQLKAVQRAVRARLPLSSFRHGWQHAYLFGPSWAGRRGHHWHLYIYIYIYSRIYIVIYIILFAFLLLFNKDSVVMLQEMQKISMIIIAINTTIINITINIKRTITRRRTKDTNTSAQNPSPLSNFQTLFPRFVIGTQKTEMGDNAAMQMKPTAARSRLGSCAMHALPLSSFFPPRATRIVL